MFGIELFLCGSLGGVYRLNFIITVGTRLVGSLGHSIRKQVRVSKIPIACLIGLSGRTRMGSRGNNDSQNRGLDTF